MSSGWEWKAISDTTAALEDVGSKRFTKPQTCKLWFLRHETQDPVPHTPAPGQGELSRALSQIIHCSSGKRKKIGFLPSSWSPTPHSHLPPHTQSHKTHFTTKPTLRVCQGSCYCNSGSTELKEAEGPIFDKHATCFYLYTRLLFTPIKGKAIPKLTTCVNLCYPWNGNFAFVYMNLLFICISNKVCTLIWFFKT